MMLLASEDIQWLSHTPYHSLATYSAESTVGPAAISRDLNSGEKHQQGKHGELHSPHLSFLQICSCLSVDPIHNSSKSLKMNRSYSRTTLQL